MTKPSNPTKIKYVVIHPDYNKCFGGFDTLEEAIIDIERNQEKEDWDDFVIYEVIREFNYKLSINITRDWVEV